MKAQVLVVEDQEPTAELIKGVLVEEGCEVQTADTLEKAREKLRRTPPEIVILDRKLPDGDGVELCAELRRDSKLAALPILMLTAKKAVEERVAGLRGGADDYLAKPFNPEELVARLEALLRRAGKREAPKAITAGDLKLDGESLRAYVKSKEVPLSGKEFDLLWYLAYRKGKVLTRDFLLQHVWGYEEGLDLSTKVVDVTVSHLRDKLGAFADNVVAVRGFGYRLDSR